LWQRDIEFFKLLGINAVRIYGMTNNNHDEFLSACQNAGVYILLTYWVNSGMNLSDPTTINNEIQNFVNMINTYKNSSAILMWVIGNELNTQYSDYNSLFNYINQLSIAGYQADPTRLFTTPLADSNQL